MNTYFFIAGLLCFLLGVVHSFLGEFLIFKHKRNIGSLVPSKDSAELKQRHLRIIWATWHLASIFGWCMGIIIIKIALEPIGVASDLNDFIIKAIMYTMCFAAFLVLIATKGKHPGWLVLLLIAIVLLIGS